MDDFAKLMGQQGVRPLGQRVEQPRRQKAQRDKRPAATAEPVAVRAPEPMDEPPVEAADPAPIAWTTGRDAVRTVQIALTRCMVERGGITLLVREEGLLVSRRGHLHSTVGDLAAEADRTDAELVVIEGRGWKTIMHPGSGVASLVENVAAD